MRTTSRAGSGRSVDGFPLLEAIETCGDLFTRFGGHAFAVGFAMPAEALPELRRRLNIHAEEKLGAKDPEHLLKIHAELPLDRITSVLAGWLKKLEPLGHGNPEPIFVARGARIASAPRIMKERHIRLDLQQDSLSTDGLGAGGRVMRCVGWDWAERCLNMQLATGSLVDVAYRIRENDHPQVWRGGDRGCGDTTGGSLIRTIAPTIAPRMRPTANREPRCW